MMAALDDAVVIPVLTEVKSEILSLDEMAEKFKILKTHQRTAAAFMKEVGVESWEKVKEEFPVHTQEAMLSQYYGLFDKNIKGTPRPMQLYAAKALNYRDKISQHEQHAAGTQDPEGLLADWVSFEGEGYKGSVKVMHCDMLQLSDKLEDRLSFTLCIFDFPCGYDADGSAHDAERFTKLQIEASVENFKKIICSPFWVLAGFCSTDMLSDVTSVFSAARNAGVEVGVWVAPNVASPGGLKFTNCWQHCVFGFHNDSGTREPLQFQFNNADSRLNCWSHNAVTKKYVFAADNEILCPYQKPVTLYEWLITKFSNPNDSYIVDAFSGSGIGVVAGLLCKRNVLAVEVDLRCVRRIRVRLAGRDFQESAKQEKESTGRTAGGPRSGVGSLFFHGMSAEERELNLKGRLQANSSASGELGRAVSAAIVVTAHLSLGARRQEHGEAKGVDDEDQAHGFRVRVYDGGDVVVLLLGLLQLAVPGLAQTPPSGTVRLESYRYSGSGCPPGRANGLLSPDGTGLTVFFAEYAAFTPGSPDDQVKKCLLAVELIYPAGFAFTLESVTVKGIAHFEEGVKGSLEVGYYISGIPGEVRTLRRLAPPVDDIFKFDDDFLTFVYAPCGSALTTLNVYSEVRVVPPPPPSNNNNGSIFIDTHDFHLRWKKC
ncbi:hypothetical protein CBR_g39710 [Chara braunii]|uniref:DNA methylase N-4/N-6 domain-containing protein n=1 Tax=Chara braunii TaxID=69332 RepID=A0A388LS41_CHABU|nr:hypothetical protein CBR_g39710 [Chara braunii]|eukprot:GBG85144.1 hypothetical protein CBR_g39710 [Chara braunii]